MTGTMIFVHGVGGSSRVWPEQVRHFSADHRVLCWNVPGYGGRPLPDPFTFEAIADRLAEDMTAFGIDRAVVVGHSFGGMIAQQLAKTHPGRISRLVLSGTSPAFGNPDGEFQKRFVADRLGPLDAGRTMADLAPGIVASLMADGADDDGRAVAVEAMSSVEQATYRASMELLVTFDLRASLADISMPTFVLAAEKDASAPAAMMSRMAAKIPGSRFHEIPEAGHLANLERPAAFNSAIRTFLKETADER